MVKYFVCYEDLLENNVLNKEFNILSSELYIIKKTTKKDYTIQPLYKFVGISDNLSNYIVCSNLKKKGIIMVEVTEEETKKINPLFIKKFKLQPNGKYKKLLEQTDKRDIKLIKYNCMITMTGKEMELVTPIVVMECKDDTEYFYLSADRSKFLLRDDIRNRRYSLQHFHNIGADIYFYTNNDELIEKYMDDVVTFKREEPDKYKITSLKLFVIDSISQDTIYDFGLETQRCFYEMCNNNSIPINIQYEDGKYNIIRRSLDVKDKKGYIITNDNLKNIFYSSAILPLIKYINVFIYEDGIYKKISLEDYLNQNTTIKLNKKPSN